MALLSYWQRRKRQRYAVYRRKSTIRLLLLLGAVLFLIWYLGKFMTP